MGSQQLLLDIKTQICKKKKENKFRLNQRIEWLQKKMKSLSFYYQILFIPSFRVKYEVVHQIIQETFDEILGKKSTQAQAPGQKDAASQAPKVTKYDPVQAPKLSKAISQRIIEQLHSSALSFFCFLCFIGYFCRS